jgi:hypothetical protein
VATWPVTLPQTFAAGGDYQEIPGTTVLRTTMDAGVTKIRRRQTRSESRMQGSMLLTTAQAAQFMLFYETTLKGGSLSFSGNLGRIGTVQNYFFPEEPTI